MSISTLTTLTEAERHYDIGNKGYLTKFERQLKDLDDDVEPLGVGWDDDDCEVPSAPTRSYPRHPRRFSTGMQLEDPNEGYHTTSNNKSGFDFRRRGSYLHEHEIGFVDEYIGGYEYDAEGLIESSLNDDMNMSLNGESEQNYQNYLTKVQREFQEAELQHAQDHGTTDEATPSRFAGFFRTISLNSLSSVMDSPRSIVIPGLFRGDSWSLAVPSIFRSASPTSGKDSPRSLAVPGLFRSDHKANRRDSVNSLAVQGLVRIDKEGQQSCPDGESSTQAELLRGWDVASLPGLFRADFLGSGCHNSRRLSLLLPSQVRALCASWKSMIMVGLVAFHLMASMSLYCTVWHQVTIPWGLSVDATSGALLLAQPSYMAVSALGRGISVDLQVLTPQESSLDEVVDHHAYACVEMETAVDLWQWTMHGMPVTVNLMQSKPPNNTEDETDSYGVQLSFQGASQNETHACLPTEDKDETLCIDLMSSRCEDPSLSLVVGGRQDDEEGKDDDKQTNNNQGTRGRRELFQSLLKDQNQVSSSSTVFKVDGKHLRRRTRHARASILFIRKEPKPCVQLI